MKKFFEISAVTCAYAAGGATTVFLAALFQVAASDAWARICFNASMIACALIVASVIFNHLSRRKPAA